jgi:hypothetical protein
MNKINHLVLHIGTIKTGSSSIQTSLGNARNVLLKHNIHYPGLKPFNHIFSFPPIFMEDPVKAFNFRKALKKSENKHRKVKRYREAWVKEIEGCEKDHFIISAEGFTQPYFTREAVKHLREFIERYFEKLTIIVYVRQYDQWISSRMQQSVRNGSYTSDLRGLANHLLGCPPGMSYQNSLEKWIKVFGREKLVVRPFDSKVFYKDSLLADFLYYSKLPVDADLIPEIRSNESIGKHAVTFLQEYNQTFPLFINNAVNLERGMAHRGSPGYLYRDLASDEKFKLELVYSPEQAQRFNEEIDFVNQFFTDGYQFHHVSPENKDLNVPIAEEIPVEFFVELINNYNKQIENLLNGNARIQKAMNAIEKPLLKRIINKFSFFRGKPRKSKSGFDK